MRQLGLKFMHEDRIERRFMPAARIAAKHLQHLAAQRFGPFGTILERQMHSETQNWNPN